MIAIRTEKLRFIVEEMQVTRYLTEHLTDRLTRMHAVSGRLVPLFIEDEW
jgi:hypothetical protein